MVLTLKAIKNYLEDNGLKYKKLDLLTNIRTDLGLDSLEVIDLLIYLETELDIELEIEEMYSINTIGDLDRYINNHQSIS
ncbi:acyl carrier protein [Ornithinibacillus massiliensis]|uniref:Acyl carrier protein n=1 Tax=Ornithinibacillus massiliensis TaxID=1944633 RepID=A0ABS5MD60_9BACI|nr:acyl carrier protein [Ornithinibacillus massiliensis]